MNKVDVDNEKEKDEQQEGTANDNWLYYNHLITTDKYLKKEESGRVVVLPLELAWLGLSPIVKKLLQDGDITSSSVLKDIGDKCHEKFPQKLRQKFSPLQNRQFVAASGRIDGGSGSAQDYDKCFVQPLLVLKDILSNTKVPLLKVEGFATEQLFILDLTSSQKKINGQDKVIFDSLWIAKELFMDGNDTITLEKKRVVFNEVEEQESKWQKRKKGPTLHGMLSQSSNAMAQQSSDSKESTRRFQGAVTKTELSESEKERFSFGHDGTVFQCFCNLLEQSILAGGVHNLEATRQQKKPRRCLPMLKFGWQGYFLGTNTCEHDMQIPHTDYDFTSSCVANTDLKDLGWNSDMPLTSEGSGIYLWTGFEKGKKVTDDKSLVPCGVLNLQLGEILLRRGDVVHAGSLPGYYKKEGYNKKEATKSHDKTEFCLGFGLRLHCSIGFGHEQALVARQKGKIYRYMVGNKIEYDKYCETWNVGDVIHDLKTTNDSNSHRHL